MPVISIAEAKRSLSALIRRAAAGERIEIGAYGRPQVALVPSVVRDTGVTLGLLAGKLTIPSGFDAPLPDSVLDEFDAGGV